MKKPSFLFLAIFLLTALSCQNASNKGGTEGNFSMAEENDAMPPQEAAPPPFENPTQPTGGQTENATPIPRQIIKTAEYRIQVKNVEASSRNINALAEEFGGFVSATELTNSSYEITNAITIRVPSGQFDSLLNAIGGEAVFTKYRRISSEDVTAEFVDIEIRLKTKKEVRDRYNEILRTKAKTVEDVLKAEEQIRVIQEEIEAKEGRLRFLKNQVGMSTVHLEIYQEIEYRTEPTVYKKSFGSKLLNSMENGWELIQALVLGLFSIWPLVLIGGLIVWKWGWVRSRFRRKKKAETELKQ
jgi:uncharacterized protein DUF4349